MAFRRSREASSAIVDNPGELRDLAESVRDRGYAHGALEPVADQIDAALHLLDDRADQLDAGAEPARLAPPEATRHRLVVAAMHYLARRDDLIPDDSPAGDIDDIVVVREVLDTVEPCLAPYRDDDPAAGSDVSDEGAVVDEAMPDDAPTHEAVPVDGAAQPRH